MLVVKCIKLSSDGRREEIECVQEDIHVILGGPVTFVGAIPEIGVVAIGLQDQTNNTSNVSCFSQFFNETIYGDVILAKVGYDGEALSLYLHEIENWI